MDVSEALRLFSGLARSAARRSMAGAGAGDVRLHPIYPEEQGLSMSPNGTMTFWSGPFLSLPIPRQPPNSNMTRHIVALEMHLSPVRD